MYTSDQRQDHIRELQEYLRALSDIDERCPRIGVDGTFGTETEEAVRTFQELYGSAVTGTVQREDWDRITAAHKSSAAFASPIAPFPSPKFVLTPASREPLVTILQVMLNDVSTVPTAVSGIYDGPTIEAIRILQTAGELPVTGLVDIVTWNLLASLYNSR